MRYLGKSLIVLLVCTVAAGTVMAQTTRGDIQGRVGDEAGTALPGVTVSIASDALIGAQATVTDAQGTYKFLVLPPGAYAVTFSMSGYQTRTQENIAVKIGSTTRVDSVMTAAFTDEVVVTSESPLVDTSSTTVGIDLSSEFFNDLPTGRNYTSVASVTPGAQNDASGQTFYGSTGAENAFYIDGANTTGVEFGTQGTTLNFEFIDEVQVKTGSYSAEYGRATGSVISVITKSGGNEFHGDVFGYYDAADLQASLKSAPAEGAVSGSKATVDYTRYDVGIDLGGYIVKDKLWFFAAYDFVSNEDNDEVLESYPIEGAPAVGSVLPDTTESDLWAGKLTWRIAADHSLSGSVFADPTSETGALGSFASTPLHYEWTQTTGGENYSFNYDGILGQNVVLSARAAQHNEEFKLSGPGVDVIGYIDSSDPLGDGTVVWGWEADSNANTRVAGLGFYSDQEFSRDQYNIDMSWFVGNLAGSHEFKGGYEFEKIGVYNANTYSGGQAIYRFNCGGTRYCGPNGEYPYFFRHRFNVSTPGLDPTTLTTADIQNPLVVDTKSENEAWFIQDTWQVTSNLSLALGVRFGAQKLFNSDGGIQANIDDEVAPRLGFVWDPTGNGKSKLFGHWGKFYETIPMDIVIRSFGFEITAFTYNFSDDANDVAGLPAGSRPASSSILGNGFSRVDPNIKGQHLEEWVVGFEYEFASDWAAGIKYIDRSLKRVIEDALSADGDYYIGNPAYGNMTGTYDIGFAYGYNEDLCGNPETCPNYHPIPVPVRDFTGVELTLKKRFSDNFQFITSFLWSELTGNYDGTFQASTGQLDPNLNSAFDYADFQVNNTGNLSNDIPFQFKFDGIYRFDFGLSTGLSFYYTDGTPITAMGYCFAYSNEEFYLSDRGAFGYSDAYYEANLHLGYPIKLGSSMELNLLVDVFNLFNMQGETGRNINYTTTDFQYDVIDWSTGVSYPAVVPNDPTRPVQNPAFNTANAWQDPTSVRLGVRLSF